jgi:hypothetical protein
VSEAVESWSDFIREPTRALIHLERGEDVILRRRDGEPLRLTLKSRAEAANLGIEIAARILADALPAVDSIDRIIGDSLSERLPWVRLLPGDARKAFLHEFAETLEACASVGNMSRLAEVVGDWKATAAIYADPKLADDLKRPLAGTATRVPRPSPAASRAKKR